MSSVVTRFILPPKQHEDVYIDNISTYTNSQNVVTDRDLHTNDPFQKKLRSSFQSLPTKYYYEVKRGQWAAYARDRKQTANVEFPESCRTDMEEVGQSWRMTTEPVKALTEKKRLFSDQATYDQVFSSLIDPRSYIIAMLLQRRLLALFSEAGLGKVKGLLKTSNAIHAEIIPKARTQVVSHGVCSIFKLLDVAGLNTGEQHWQLYDYIIDDAKFSLSFLKFNKKYVSAISSLIKYSNSEADPSGFKKIMEVGWSGTKSIDILWENLISDIEDDQIPSIYFPFLSAVSAASNSSSI